MIKTPQEVEIMRYAARVSSEAHKAVMRRYGPQGLPALHICRLLFALS